MVQSKPEVCNFCIGAHAIDDCQNCYQYVSSYSKEANYVGNYNKENNPFSNSFNQGWRNHPNLSWKSKQNVLKPPTSFQPPMHNQVQHQAPISEMPLEDVLAHS